MQKHRIDDTTGISYTLSGDYYIPDLALPDDAKHSIGRFGQAHRKYIKAHRRAFYISLLTSGKLNQYLHQMDKDANARFDALVADYAKANSTDENLKACDQIRWVGLMNSYRHSAEEVIMSELIMPTDIG